MSEIIESKVIDVKEDFIYLVEHGIDENTLPIITKYFEPGLEISELTDSNKLCLYNILTLVETKIFNIPSLYVSIQALKLNILKTCIMAIETTDTCTECTTCSGCDTCAEPLNSETVDKIEISTKDTKQKEWKSVVAGVSNEDIFFANDVGVILKKYMPENGNFNLPEEGGTGTLFVRGVNIEGKEFKGIVLINHLGEVVEVIEEPYIDEEEVLDFDKLYNDLASEVLKFKK